MAQVKCSKCAFVNESRATKCRRCGTALPSISFEAQENQKPKSDPQEAMVFKRGQVINGRYTVLDMIGRGGMGCIYKVHDNTLGEDLALKTLLPQYVSEQSVVERFYNEARITRRLTHPNIVRVHDIGTAGKGLFISMEYVKGESLRAVLEKLPASNRLPVRQVLHIIDQLCLALDYAHQYTIHRDIKPENIMITESNQIKLMDFGISKLMSNPYMTSASVVMGTPHYMSPEQFRNARDVDARADIYSIGVVLYEMLTGNIPRGIPKPASHQQDMIPPALDEIIWRCLDPDRNKRFRSAGELRQAILPLIQSLDEGKDEKKTLAKRRLPSPRHSFVTQRAVLAAALSVVVIVACGVGMYGIERMYFLQPPTANTPLSNLPEEHAAQIQELRELADLLSKSIQSMQLASERQSQWFSQGDALWRNALQLAQRGDPTAIPTAQSAVQHYAAVLMNPDTMAFIPGGYVSINDETVYVPGFFMDITEVTIQQFSDFCRQVEGGWPMPPELQNSEDQYPNYPVVYVAWFDAQAYAAFSQKELPTLEHWARAAYGTDQVPGEFPWGNTWRDGAANVMTSYSSPVKQFSDDLTSAGCYDLVGNVREWTRTLASDHAVDGEPYFGDPLYVCGSSFSTLQSSKTPGKANFEARLSDLGFRCIKPISIRKEDILSLLAKVSGTPS